MEYFVRELENVADVAKIVNLAKKVFTKKDDFDLAISKLVKVNQKWENQIYFQVYCK
jgi:hypothetical protein